MTTSEHAEYTPTTEQVVRALGNQWVPGLDDVFEDGWLERWAAALASTPSPAQPTEGGVRASWCRWCQRGMHDRCSTGSCACPGVHPASLAPSPVQPTEASERDALAHLIESLQHPHHVDEAGADALNEWYLADAILAAGYRLAPSPAQPTEPAHIEQMYYGFIKRASDEGIEPEQWDTWALTALWNAAQIEAALAPSPVQGADDRLALSLALHRKSSYTQDGKTMEWAWRCTCGEELSMGGSPVPAGIEVGYYRQAQHQAEVLATYKQSPQAALNEARAGALLDAANEWSKSEVMSHWDGYAEKFLRARAAELRGAPQTGEPESV